MSTYEPPTDKEPGIRHAAMQTAGIVVRNRFLGGTITLHRSYEPLVHYIERRTPTAYGRVRFSDTGEGRGISLFKDISEASILDLISSIQRDNNYNIQSRGTLEDFLGEDESFVRLLHGGSAGQVLLLKSTKTGENFVRKVAARYGVEGNGSPKLHAEIRFLAEIYRHPIYKKLTGLYPRVIDYAETEQFITLDQVYIGNGSNVFTLLSQGRITADEHRTYVRRLLSALIPHGYSLASRAVGRQESLAQLEDYYVRRAEGRIRFLQNCGRFTMDFPALPHTSLPELIRRKVIRCNGVEYKNPLEILARIRSHTALIERLRPRSEHFCAHGDMTFLNMVYNTQTKAYILIDNRGYIGNWDALYDFGKLKFTLSGFGKVMRKEFDLSEDSRGAFRLRMTGDPHGTQALHELNRSFLDDMQAHSEFRKLCGAEPYWRDRILAAEAIHYLADIPHRLLLDQSPKHAVAVFLLGTIYLNALYARLTHE